MTNSNLFIDALVECASNCTWGDNEEYTTHYQLFGALDKSRAEYLQKLANANVEKVTNGVAHFDDLRESLTHGISAYQSVLNELQLHPEDFSNQDAFFLTCMFVVKVQEFLSAHQDNQSGERLEAMKKFLEALSSVQEQEK